MASFGGQQNKDGMPTTENSSSGLRQPKKETISRLLNTNGGTGGVGGSKPSNLSVNAPEFVPRMKSGYKAPSLSASAPEFVPRQQIVDVYPQQQIDSDPVLEEFKQTLYILNTQPGNVEEYIRPLCEKFQQGVTTADQMTEIIDALFRKSVEEQNFRYTGARICQQICTVLKDHPILCSFRGALLKRCQREYNRREDLVTNPDELELLTGFTLFMGELFLNLEMVEKNGGKIKMKILPDILKDLVLTLLSQPSKVTVKCTCQLLKLVGYNMEIMMQPDDGSPSPFDEVFTQLQLVMQSPILDETSKFMIKSVLNLRQSNWGHESISSSISGDSDFNGSLPSGLLENEPVFYNESGQTISREEAGFYNEEVDEAGYILNDEEQQFLDQFEAESNGHAGYHNDAYGNWSHTDDQGYYGVYNNEGEMDDEAEAAYDEFLKTTQGYH